jgi:uncharacterized repeat protein (TIGR03803 family)
MFCSPAFAELQTRKGHVPRVAAGLRPVDRVQPTQRLDLAIGLPLRNREALTKFLSDLYDPTSLGYRQFLSPQQFAERFGPTEQDYQAVIAFAKSNHFVITGKHANRMLLDVNVAAADVERSFHLRLHVYQHPTRPRRFYAPDTDPSVDSQIPILSIAGLDDFFIPQPVDFRARFSPARTGQQRGSSRTSSPANNDTAVLDATGSGPAGNFLGRDFRAAYAPGVPLDGSGQSVGLVALDNYYSEDIIQYENLAGLPRVPLTNVLVNGFNRAPGPNNGEVALDIQMTISMAPGLASVLVYEGAIGNDVLNRMATDNLARQLSSSWSFGHPVDATREQIFQQFAAQGQSFFQASGDDGAYGTVFQPADDPFVTAVGGTALTTSTPGGSWLSETTWFGSGGGVSPNYPIPSWQRSVNMAANLGSVTMRNVPDVAAQADATIWVIANNGEQGTVGGTSAAAPLWAGFAALANQQAAANHQPAIGFLNPALYVIGQAAVSSSAFHDISSGNNTSAASPTRFFSVPGYDLCTGWGSPGGSNLISALLAPPDALQISPVTPLVVMGPAGGPFTPSTQSMFLTNTSANSLSWAIGGIPTWLSIAPSSGVLTPGGVAATLTVTTNSTSSTLTPGAYSADLWFTNLNNGFAQRRAITLDVAATPVILTQTPSQTVPAGATVQFVVTTAPNALLEFQWRTNGVDISDGPNVTGTRTSVLTLENVTSANDAPYSVLVSNVAGVTISSPATLSVTSSRPIIVVQPASQTVLPDSTANFSVIAYGNAPLSYRWLHAGTNLLNTARVTGSQSSNLSISEVSAADAGAYSVLVTNILGSTSSADASLQVVVVTTPELLQTTLHHFTGAADGAHPNALSVGRNGALYGSTQSGGANDSGTLFKISAGQVQTLYSFTGLADGERPNGGLVERPEGWFGTTFRGGANGFGTLFKLDTNNVLTTLFTLDHTDGVLPMAGLSLSPNGDLFGAAYEGGVNHYGTLFRFDKAGAFSVQLPFGSTNGAFPASPLALASDGKFYGTTYKGGESGKGTVFAITPAGSFASPASFDGTNGAFPVASVTQVDDGSFYGATTAGGVYGLGNLFQITSDGLLTNVFSFTGQADGSHPRSTMLLSRDGNLYGTTQNGGAFGFGTIYRLAPGGALTTIAQFDGYNGANPDASLVEAPDGTLYGTTQNGGAADAGVIFQLSVPATKPQITAQPVSINAYAGATVQFAVASIGTPPLSYQWLLNGTNLNDSLGVSGSTARVITLQNVTTAAAGAYAVLVSNKYGTNLSSPANLGVLVSAPFVSLQPTNQTVNPGATVVFKAVVLGNLPLSYQWKVNGTAVLDGANVAGAQSPTLVLTRVTEANNGVYTLLATNSLGFVQTTDATLTVVPVSAPGTAVRTLYSFSGQGDPGAASELVDGGDGNLYGTTPRGGGSNSGTIFRISTNGVFATAFEFRQTNGALPFCGLTRGPNNVLYGTTSFGGPSGGGTLFSFAPSGQLTTLHAFTSGTDGGAPVAKLALGIDGNLYGPTTAGGQLAHGTLYRVTGDGQLTTLYSFKGGIDGTSSGPLLATSNGDLFGLTADGGVFTNGSAFRWNPGASPTTIYSFSGGLDGSEPVGGLVQGDDGSFYGATRLNSIRGFTFYGTLFNLTAAGALTTLYSLNFTDGSYPAAGLLLASDGNFYGTTERGGSKDYGTLIRMTPDGQFSTLLEFDGFNNGANPVVALTEGPDASIYGTTSSGGPGGKGTIFRLSFTGPPQITSQPRARAAVGGGSARFSASVSGAPTMIYRWQKNGTNLADSANIHGTTSRVLTLDNVSLTDAGSYSVLVTNSLGSAQSLGALLTVQPGPPLLTAIIENGGSLLLTWSTIPNRVYQLQSTTAFQPTSWINVGSSVTAGGQSFSTSLPIGPGSQLFYRVVLLP